MTDAWAFGFVCTGQSLSATTIDQNGSLALADVDQLWSRGVPTAGSARLNYCGDPSEWERVTAEDFLPGIGIALPDGLSNRHAVFLASTPSGTVAIPALVLMRAMFQPATRLLAQALKPQGIDAISYVDHSTSPPKVVIDNRPYSNFVRRVSSGWRKERPLEWLQLSRSARAATSSAQLYARSGAIDLVPPKGLAKFVFQGVMRGPVLLVSRASLTSIGVQAADSLTGLDETFDFHGAIKMWTEPQVSLARISFPAYPERKLEVSDAEWEDIAPMLDDRKLGRPLLHSKRVLLNAILYKLAHGVSWSALPYDDKVSQSSAKAFRRWTLTDRLPQVLGYLMRHRALHDSLIPA